MLLACKPIAKNICDMYSTLYDAEFYEIEAN